MGKQMFEADGRYLGQRVVPNFRRFDDLGHQIERSYAYFCPKCGDIWGRLVHEGAIYTTCIYRECRRHGDGRLSLMFPAGAPLGIARDWPRDALLREFMIELEQAK